MKHLKLRPLQQAGAAFLENHPKAYLALRMRLGKTATALQQARKGMPTLVVAPVSVLYHWADEVHKWRPGLTVEVIRQNRKATKQGNADVCVVPYSILAKLLKDGKLKRPHYVILDEAHYCKSQKAQRTKAATFLIKSAERAVALTGTPIPNRPVELYPLLNAMGAPFAKTKTQFGYRFCDAKPSPFHPGLDYTGSSNLDELRDELEDWMFYSQGGYVSPVTTVIEVDANITREERNLIDLIDWSAEDPEIPFERLSLVRRLSGEQKLAPTLEVVMNTLEEMEKVVVFCHHKELIHALAGELEAADIKVATLTGAEVSPRRVAAVDAFQSGDARVFIGNIQAAGEGISLAAASHVIFAEQAWTPGAMDQAAARIETADMDRVTSIDYIVRRGGIDSKLLAKIEEKRAIIEAALNDQGEAQ